MEDEVICTGVHSSSVNPFMLIDSIAEENSRATDVIKMIVTIMENELGILVSSSDYTFISNTYKANQREINKLEDLLKSMQLQNIKSSSEQKIVESLASFLEKY